MLSTMPMRDELAYLRNENCTLSVRVAELEQQRPDPPPFSKPNQPKPDALKRPRKKRAAQPNRGRRCEPPTRVDPHALDTCPDCTYRLQGQSVDYQRQVIELPPPQPVEALSIRLSNAVIPSVPGNGSLISFPYPECELLPGQLSLAGQGPLCYNTARIGDVAKW